MQLVTYQGDDGAHAGVLTERASSQEASTSEVIFLSVSLWRALLAG